MLTEIKGYLYVAGGVALLALLVGAFFYGEHRIEVQDAAKFAAIKQAAVDEQKETDRIDTANNFVTKDAYNALKTQLVGYTASVNDLTKRMRDAASKGGPVLVSETVGATCQPADQGTVGSAEAGNPGPTESVTRLPTEILRDDLTLALQNIEALRVIIDTSDRVQR